MQWLERVVQLLTARPLLGVALGLVVAAVALQTDGILWNTPMNPTIRLGVLAINAAVGIGGLILSCFSLHGAWFRRRHGDELEAALPSGMPNAPWEQREAVPVGPAYLRSLQFSGFALGLGIPLILVFTPAGELAGIAFVGPMAVAVLATLLTLWLKFTSEPA